MCRYDEVQFLYGPVGHTHNGIDAKHKTHNQSLTRSPRLHRPIQHTFNAVYDADDAAQTHLRLTTMSYLSSSS